MEPITLEQLDLIKKAAVQLNEQNSSAGPADQALIDKFTNLMQTGTPELEKVKQIVAPDSRSLSVSSLNNLNGITPDNLNFSVDKALSGQTLLTSMTISTDIAAKLAGYFSQAINKLVNIQ